MNEVEKLRGLLREVRVLLTNSSYKISGTAAFLSSIDAALSQQAEPVCDTCHGQGEVWTGENQSFGYMSMQPPEPIMEACPECGGEAEPAPAQDERDREADRARFPDPTFNKWLDEVISDAGHTVWDQVNVCDAWAGWENRQWYTAPQHTDDEAVDRFAVAMKAKLAASRAKGRGGWDDASVCTVEFLAQLLVEHLGKGNAGTFEDVANFAMMLHQRGADPMVLANATRPAQDEREAFEAWAKLNHFGTQKPFANSNNYESGYTNFCWKAWQARAARSAQTAPQRTLWARQCDLDEPDPAQDEREAKAWPALAGIGRDSGHPRAVVLYLRHEPSDEHLRMIQEALRTRPAQNAPQGKFAMGDRVKKTSGSEWVGHVCGTYSTALTPEGYAVESEAHAGSVQIYPAKALEAVE